MTRAASRRTGRILVLWAVGLVCWCVAGTARAEGGACADAFAEWTRSCSKQAGLEVSARHCLPNGVVVSLAKRGQPLLDVEIDGAGTRGFRRVAGLALSPVGELGDWAKVSRERRDALDALAKCVQADPALPGLTPPPAAPQANDAARAPPPPAPLPWRAIAGVAIGVALAVRALRRRPRTALALALASAASFALRWRALPHGYFHQNGHGPDWMRTALLGGSLSDYGPGYAEMFGLAARAGTTPEHGVYLEQALLAALAAPCAFVVARRVGARASIATALALCVAVDPLLLRTSVSESYFATGTSLLFVAAALLACGAARARWHTPHFVLAVTGAGLLVAQVARIHPLLWVGAACLPVVVVVGPGRWRARLVLAGATALGVGVVTAAFAGSTLREVLRGELGRAWIPVARGHLVPALVAAGAALLALAVLRFVPPRARRLVVPLACLALVLGVARASDVLGAPNPAVGAAQARVFWPAAIACVASLLGRAATPSRRARWLGAAVAALGIVFVASSYKAMTTRPTDALEADFATEWRASLPAHARVLYLARAHKRIVSLPLFESSGAGIDAVPLSLAAPPPDPRALGDHVYYYRSSLCSSTEGAAFCDALERVAPLERVVVRRLPARPSMRWDRDGYDSDAVMVALYRVLPARAPR